jgi:hypothetical protein
MLSPKLLEALRVYWRGLKRKPRARGSPAPAPNAVNPRMRSLSASTRIL